jgi:fatty-acyl-CoA synthase
MIESLRRQPSFEPAALRGLTALVSGGAHHRIADIEAWLADEIPLVLGFGMTEAGTVFGMSVERPVIRSHLGSAGIATPGMQVRVVDERGHDCDAGQPGELLLRGEAITPGYWRAPEETRRAIDAAGWFATGDIARSDADGFFWIVDRKKDMFISGGENVYPAEIEMLLVGFPGIEECAVVGLPDERWGESAILVVVRAHAVPFSDDAVLQYLQQRLARYKLPRRVVTMSSLPRTATGKLQKDRLRAQLLQSDAVAAVDPKQ